MLPVHEHSETIVSHKKYACVDCNKWHLLTISHHCKNLICNADIHQAVGIRHILGIWGILLQSGFDILAIIKSLDWSVLLTFAQIVWTYFGCLLWKGLGFLQQVITCIDLICIDDIYKAATGCTRRQSGKSLEFLHWFVMTHPAQLPCPLAPKGHKQ